MELIYVGGFDAVEVRVPDWGPQPIVARGNSYDFPNLIAASLLEQPDNWQRKQPEISLEDRIAAIKTHDDANEIGVELGLRMQGRQPALDEKKQELERATAALAAGNDDNAGQSGEE